MRREDRIRIRHLTEAASKAFSHSAGKQRVDLDDDELLRLALTKLVKIVGEAAKNVSPEARAALPRAAAQCGWCECTALTPGHRRRHRLARTP